MEALGTGEASHACPAAVSRKASTSTVVVSGALAWGGLLRSASAPKRNHEGAAHAVEGGRGPVVRRAASVAATTKAATSLGPVSAEAEVERRMAS